MTMRRRTPYVLTGTSLVVGLLILQFGPLSRAALNYLVGGAFLAVAVASVSYMIVAFSGPDERKPDF